VNVTDEILASPAERLGLWQRMSVFDARATLGYYCYRAGNYQDALRIWDRIPSQNLKVRPEIAAMLDDVEKRLHIEAEVTAEPVVGGSDGDGGSESGVGQWIATRDRADRERAPGWPGAGRDDATASARSGAAGWQDVSGWPDSSPAYRPQDALPAPTPPPAVSGDTPPTHGDTPRLAALADVPLPTPAPTTQPVTPAEDGGYAAMWQAGTYLHPTRLRPVAPDELPQPENAPPPLWSAAGWAAATSNERVPLPETDSRDPGTEDPQDPPYGRNPPSFGR
jgi:hypothetical protein